MPLAKKGAKNDISKLNFSVEHFTLQVPKSSGIYGVTAGMKG